MNHHFKPTAVTRALLAVCTVFAMATVAQAADTKLTHEQAKQSAKASHDMAKKQCASLAGNAKDICLAEAKLVRQQAESKAEVEYKNTAKVRYSALVDVANAELDLAKERCDDKGGNEKDVCVKEAKAQFTKAKADAKLQREVVAVNKDATQDKMKADYKVAIEKCDALAGDLKDSCIKQAKVAYKM